METPRSLSAESLENKKKFEIPAEKKVFVDVGINELPLSFSLKGKVSPEEFYIGIDIVREYVKRGKKHHELVSDDAINKNSLFLQADATHLPLPNKIADTLYFGNVFGAPRILPKEKEEFILEITRVLKDDGVCIISETNTPPNSEQAETFFKESGFNIVKKLLGKDPKEVKEIEKYGWILGQSNDAFVFFLQKDKAFEGVKKIPEWEGGFSFSRSKK